MGRGRRSKSHKEIERRCLVTRLIKPKTSLIRFVCGPDQTLVPDVFAKLPGRGMWVTAERELIETAVRKNVFFTAAKMRLRYPTDLADLLETLLVKRTIEALCVARKSGLAVSGFEKTRGLLRGQSRVGLLIQAADAARDGKDKLQILAKDIPMITALRSDELGLAFGRSFVVHAALSCGGALKSVMDEGQRLAGFRQESS